MDAGASDHFTKMDENEMAIIEIISGRPMDLVFSCVIVSSFQNDYSKIIYHNFIVEVRLLFLEES
ncbi:hypothetical protein AM1BK_12940 [Neobacillus kokaensis]|uniref:Uncharacterized protein n=1 Tax=Neobacillus kokaensis TaxID=2759023 RepID=A0ABQ3N8T8_9BACI|nr:hypothetical protein AM1BK_12940 [Neobacillus kokaensis]